MLFSFLSFFKYLNLGLGWSTFFALLISCLAYPISGSPFRFTLDFFLLFGIYFIIISIIKDNNKLWFFAPIFFYRFLCKQVPSFYIGLLAIYFVYLFKVKKINILFSYILGGVSAVLLFQHF